MNALVQVQEIEPPDTPTAGIYCVGTVRSSLLKGVVVVVEDGGTKARAATQALIASPGDVAQPAHMNRQGRCRC